MNNKEAIREKRWTRIGNVLAVSAAVGILSTAVGGAAIPIGIALAKAEKECQEDKAQAIQAIVDQEAYELEGKRLSNIPKCPSEGIVTRVPGGW